MKLSEFNEISHSDRSDKYSLLETGDAGFYRIKALRDFSDVKSGDVGGIVSGFHNLSQNGSCWIYDNAQVLDSARLEGDAIARNFASIEDAAVVKDRSRVEGRVVIKDRATAQDNAVIKDNATIEGGVVVRDFAEVSGFAQLARLMHQGVPEGLAGVA